MSGPPTNLAHCPVRSSEPIQVPFLYLNLEPPFWIPFCPQTAAAPSNGPSYLPLLSLLSLPFTLKLFSPSPPDPRGLHFLLCLDHQMPQTVKAFLTLNEKAISKSWSRGLLHNLQTVASSLFFPSGGLRSKVEPSKKPLHTSQGRFFLRKIHSTPPKPPTLRPTLFPTDTHRLSSCSHPLYCERTSPLSRQAVHMDDRGLISLCGFLSPVCPCLSAQLWLLLYTH